MRARNDAHSPISQISQIRPYAAATCTTIRTQPPAPAVMKISRASGYRFAPTCLHQVSIEVTAKTGVSWSTPTLTKPSLAARSYTPYGIALPTASEGKSCPGQHLGELFEGAEAAGQGEEAVGELGQIVASTFEECNCTTACTPEADSACFGNAVNDVDSCGNPGALTEVCPCGCAADEPACSPFSEPSVDPANDPACAVRTDCVAIERVVCEQRPDGKWHTETRYTDGCAEAVRCAGYGTEAFWTSTGLIFDRYSLNGTSWGPGQAGQLVVHAYDTLEACELASNIGGPSNHACVTLESPATCLPTAEACEQLCP